MRRAADYNGWSNWDTWHTKLMMDNDQDLYNKSREIVDHGVEKGWSDEEIAKRLQEWAVRNIISPHNRDAIKDAQEWNDIPKEERIDPHYEDLKNKSPQAADLVDSLGFGPNVEDTEPTLIREDLVNWDELVQDIKNEFKENDEYERQEQRKAELTPYDIVHWNDEHTKMMDAWLSHHGVDPHARSYGPDGERERGVWGHQQWVPIDLIKQNVTEYGWPHGFGDATAKQIEDEGGWNYSTRDLGEQAATALQRGQAVPWQQETMQKALQAKGYTPEEAQQIMRQRYKLVPNPNYPDQNMLVDMEKPPPQPDPSLDQPGNLTLPEHWGSFTEEPHAELYPCLFEGRKTLRWRTVYRLKNYILDKIASEFPDADKWIYFTLYGSGISYNWDEEGDLDVQMWLDIDKYNRYNDPTTSDELVAAVRRAILPVNFPTCKKLGLTYKDCAGKMIVQYFAKPGTGSEEENLASQPYACYDLEQNKWLKKPEPFTPKFYGEEFLLVEPEAKELAVQINAALDALARDLADAIFWDDLYEEYGEKKYLKARDEARALAEKDSEGVHELYVQVYKGRQEAYSPEGKGINDSRDALEKLLEQWGIFQRLKEQVHEPLPWKESHWGSVHTADEWDEYFDQSNDPYAEDYYEKRRPFMVEFANSVEDPAPKVWIGEPNTFHGDRPRDFDTPGAQHRYYGEIWENTNPPTFKGAPPDRVYDEQALYHAQRAYYNQQNIQKRASDGGDWWSQSQDDWWGTQADSLFNVNVPGDAPGMPHEMITDSLHCPHCNAPMHGLECAYCGFKKEAMADRSGDPQLDALIEEYLAQNQFDWWDDAFERQAPYKFKGEDPNYTRDQFIQDQIDLNGSYGPGMVTENQKDADAAYGRCGTLAIDFMRFLWNKGIKAETHQVVPEEFYPEVSPENSTGGHCVTKVTMPSGTYTIDWTAAQYAEFYNNNRIKPKTRHFYNEFPLVQRQDDEGTFQRKWAADHWKDEPRDEEGKWTRHPASLKPVRGKHHRLKVHDHDKSTPEHHIVRCFHCGAPMDVYKGEESTCLNCGERRGFEDPLLDSLKDHKHSRVATGDPTKSLLQAGFEPFAQTNHADVFQWTDPGTGMLHRISVSRNNPDREQYVREDLGKCHSGRCRCGTQLWQPAQAEAMAGSEEPVRSNDQVQYQGETWVVGEIAGELADIINMQTGETEIAPVRELQLVAADMVPQDQIKVMPDEPLSDWGEGQWDSDTFLDHNMINEHLKSRAQIQQYEDYLKRQKRKKDAEWAEIGMREAGMTNKQLLEQMAALPPDRSTVEHEFPDGWTIRKPGTFGDIHRVGELMGNCWSLSNLYRDEMGGGYDAHPDWPRSVNGYDGPDGWEPYAADILTSDEEYQKILNNLDVPMPSFDSDPAYPQQRWLADPEGIPHAAFYYRPTGEANDVSQMLGRHNSAPKPQYVEYVQNWLQGMHNPYSLEHDQFDNPGVYKIVQGARKRPTNAQEPIDHFDKTAADNVPGAPVSDSGHWVYLDGHVGMGGIHSDIAESLARDLGYDDTKVNYLSNWIARGHVPEDMAVAVGTLKNNYPYIWNSTRDRNHVFDSVREHVDKNPIPAVTAMRRFAGFFLVSADVDELAEKARQNLFNREDLVNMNRQYLSPEGTPSASGLGQDEQGNITVPEGLKPEPNPKYNPGLYNDIQRTLERLPSEHYKFYPWVTKQMKKSVTPTLPGGGNVRYPWNTNGHLNDILTQAFRHMEYLRSQPKNSPNAAPVPDINQMDWPGLEKWVYDRNALGIDVRPGTQWEYTEKQPAYDEHTPPNLTAYKWPVQEKKWDVGDGYTVWPVWSKNDLAQEGNMMGHCVGGYCNTVQQGNSVIFSLRDSKGEPHVTIELEPRSGGYNIIQIQGKGNTDPDDKYVQKVKQFFQDLMAEGYEVSYTVSISDASELEDYGYTSTPSEAYGVPIEADINTYGIARDLAEQAADGYLSGSAEKGLDKLIDERLVDPRDLGAEIRSECEDKLEAKEREYESDWQDERDRLEEKYEDAKREYAYARAEEEYNNMDPDDEDAEEPDPDDYEDEFPDFVDWLAEFHGEAWEKEYYGTDFRQQAEDELPEVVDLMYRYG